MHIRPIPSHDIQRSLCRPPQEHFVMRHRSQQGDKTIPKALSVPRTTAEEVWNHQDSSWSYTRHCSSPTIVGTIPVPTVEQSISIRVCLQVTVSLSPVSWFLNSHVNLVTIIGLGDYWFSPGKLIILPCWRGFVIWFLQERMCRTKSADRSLLSAEDCGWWHESM